MTCTKASTYEELNAVLERARRPAAQPVAVTDAQLVGLQYRWATALSARLDEAIEFAPPEQVAQGERARGPRLPRRDPCRQQRASPRAGPGQLAPDQRLTV